MSAEAIVTTPPARARRPAAPTALLRGSAAVAGLLALWWVAGDVLGAMPERTLPRLSTVLGTLGSLMVEPYAGATLPQHIGQSLTRWGLGLLASIGVGVPLGMVMGWYRIADAIVGPLFHALRSVPPLAWIPLAILWLGTGLITEVMLVFVAAFPPMVLNAYHGARSIDRQVVWAARTAGAGSLRQLVQIVIPTELPQLISGVRVALGNGLMAVIAAELVSARSGLGFIIVRGQQDFRPDLIVVGMLVIAAVGLAADAVLWLATTPLLRWRNTDDGH